MIYTKKDTSIYLISLLLVFVAAWYLQNKFFLNWDVGWLLHSTELALQGKTYSQDFFSPNPPIVLLLYLPVVLLSKLPYISIMLAFKLYIFLLSAISLWLCSIFAWKIFTTEDNFLGGCFLVILSSLFLVLPMAQLGQRDCLLLVFIMPYVLAIAYRLEGNTPSAGLAVVVGLFAGCGVAMKPQFLVVPLLLELYYRLASGKKTSWLRAETLGILAVLVFSVALALIFFPDFFTVVMPAVWQKYYALLGISSAKLFYHPIVTYCCLAIVFYLLEFNSNRYRPLSTVLMLTLLGLLSSFFLQRNLFLYHLLPALTLAILLLVLLLGKIATRRARTTEYLHLTSMAILFLLFICCLFPLAYLLLAIHTEWFWGYLAMILVVMLVASPRQLALSRRVLLILAAGLLFAFPISGTYNVYLNAVVYRQQILVPLINFMHTLPPGQSIYAISTNGSYASPLFYYTGATLTQRYDCLWMAGELAVRERDFGAENLLDYIRHNKDENFFLNKVAEDFRLHQPSVVLVDVTPLNVRVNGAGLQFAFLKNFGAFDKFAQEWRHYHYVTTLHGNGISLEVYTRKS
jgi:hypothetical protein